MEPEKKANIYEQLSSVQQKIAALSNKKKTIYGKRLDIDNILGKHFKIQHVQSDYPDIKLAKDIPEIPVFGEIKIHKLDEIKRPPTPDLVKKIRKQRKAEKEALKK